MESSRSLTSASDRAVNKYLDWWRDLLEPMRFRRMGSGPVNFAAEGKGLSFPSVSVIYKKPSSRSLRADSVRHTCHHTCECWCFFNILTFGRIREEDPLQVPGL